jgi:hypothetical protein
MAGRAVFLRRPAPGEAASRPAALPEALLLVPRDAIIEREGQRGVFCVEAGRLLFRPVTGGVECPEGYALRAGPRAGSVVVRAPAPELREGMLVEPAAETPGKEAAQ